MRAIDDMRETYYIIIEYPNLKNPPIIVIPDINGQKGLPDNTSNPIYREILNASGVRNLDRAVSLLSAQFRLQQSRDFEKVGARLLRSSEYHLDPDLGYISLITALRLEQVLGVACDYEYNGVEFQV